MRASDAGGAREERGFATKHDRAPGHCEHVSLQTNNTPFQQNSLVVQTTRIMYTCAALPHTKYMQNPQARHALYRAPHRTPFAIRVFNTIYNYLCMLGLAISWTTRSSTSSWNMSKGESFSATCVLASGEVMYEV